jgi:biotin carboxyl carrier protein
VRYHVLLGTDPAVECAVDLVELPNGSIEARIEDRRIELDIVPIGSAFSVRVGAQMIDLTLCGTLPALDVTGGGYRSRARVESDRMRTAGRAADSKTAHGERVVKSPMPGRVVKILVAKGDTVRAGQGLVVLEAMKMENEVRAPAAGTVAAVHVTSGSAVEGSAVLVTLT